jgi:hypothetical protein
MRYIKAFESWTNKENASFDVITNFNELSIDSKWINTENLFDKYFSLYGPFILITCKEHPVGCYLGQKRKEDWVFFDDKDNSKTLEDISSELKMDISELEKTLNDLVG